MKNTAKKFPSFNPIEYPDMPPTGGTVWNVQGTAFYGGSAAFFGGIRKKFFDPLVDMAKEYLAKHTQPDNIVNPLQPDELKGEVITVRSDN